MYQEIQLSLTPASLSFSLASPSNQFHTKAVQMRFNFVVQPVSFCSLRALAQIRCQCLSVFIQKSLHDSGSSAPRECHNARKLPPLSHKPDVLLREVQVSIGNSPLCYSVKVLDPDTAAVHSCSESERSSGRCPPLLWHQETPSQSRSPWQEASITTLSSEVVFWIVS